MRSVDVAAIGSPVAGVLHVGGMPWPAELALALSGPLACALHRFWTYRLSRRALERADPRDIPAVLAYATGQHPAAVPKPSRRLAAPVPTTPAQSSPGGAPSGP